MRTHYIPVIVGGVRIDSGEMLSFNYETCEVILPRVPIELVRSLVSSPPKSLTDVSIDDIVLFFDRVGRSWNDPANHWRRLALELSANATGYAGNTVAWDVNFIGGILQRQKLYDLLDTDLGDAGLLDEFTRYKAVNRRCFPLGRVLNLLVGNVPIASFISILRSLVTKNETICKLPSRDVATALCFANCILDTDPSHPVVAALTCGYWEVEGQISDLLFDAADGVVVWGRGATVASVRARTPTDTPLIEYGPKRSLAIVDLALLGEERVDVAARRIAYDICSYDQEACFSVQQVFCIGGNPDRFSSALRDALADYASTLPARRLSLDEQYHVLRARADAAAWADTMQTPERVGWWTIIRTGSPRHILDHPLGRTIYVQSVLTFDEVLPWIDRSVQTVSYEPYDHSAAVAGQIANAGADRIVRSGRHGRFRPGISQDGSYGMNRLVRWVTWERDLDYKYRFMSANATEDERRIYYQLATKAE